MTDKPTNAELANELGIDVEHRPGTRTGNLIRNLNITGNGWDFQMSIRAADTDTLAQVMWDQSRELARAAARLEANIRPYHWDRQL